MCWFIQKYFHNSCKTPAVFLHTQTVNQTAFIVGYYPESEQYKFTETRKGYSYAN